MVPNRSITYLCLYVFLYVCLRVREIISKHKNNIYISIKLAGKQRQPDKPELVWHSVEEKPWEPRQFPFTGNPGLQGDAAAIQSDKPCDFLELILSDALMEVIVEQTNIYAEKSIAAMTVTPSNRLHKWQPVTLPELKQFFGLCFITGIIVKPTLDDYWTQDEVYETPYFSKVMTRNRFQCILRHLHYTDREPPGNDKMFKIRGVLEMMLSRFKELYQPSENIAIDEGTLGFRGRLSFKIFNPLKPTRFGVKSFILACSGTGYCFSMQPYCGTYSSLIDTVTYLLGDLANHGYHLYMDNYYNSVEMCEMLLSKGTHVCGTIRACRGTPDAIQQASLKTMEKGGKISLHTEDILVLAWRDNKIVRMVTTFHPDTMQNVQGWRKRVGQVMITKPQSVIEYNGSMNGVDRLDQNLSYYPFTRKTHKWTNKFMLYMFQICMYNSFVLYSLKHPEGRYSTMRSFMDSVIKAWTTSYFVPIGPQIPTGPEMPRGPRPRRAPRMSDPQTRLSPFRAEKHVPIRLKPNAKKQEPTRKCRVCTANKVRHETRYQCRICHVPLCRNICFKRYHTELNYGQLDD